MSEASKNRYSSIAAEYKFYLEHESSSEFSRAGFVLFLTEAYPDMLLEVDSLFACAEKKHKKQKDILEEFSSYSRMDSIKDGNLIEAPINEIVKHHGIRFHSAATHLLHQKLISFESDKVSLIEIYSEIVREFKNAAKEAESDRLTVSLLFTVPTSSKKENLEVDVFIAEGDDGETVLTFMLSHED